MRINAVDTQEQDCASSRLKEPEEARFMVSNTALEILNGYTKAQEEQKLGLVQIVDKTKLPEVRHSAGRQLLYRYEQNGVVVYDSHSRCSDDRAKRSGEVLQPRALSPLQRKELDSACDYDKAMFLHMPQYPPTKTLPEEYTLVIPLDNTLRFDSKFESGNLRKAIKITENEYTLLQEYDIDTKGHTQWFYFSVRNADKGHCVRFSIVNLMKYDSLYNNGLKPLVFSVKKEKNEGVGWYRTQESVSYYQNNLPRPGNTGKLPSFYYTLSFNYTFEYAHDLVFFAHCYPYSYSTLQSYLHSLKATYGEENILRVDSLCVTEAGNSCPVLTITSNVHTYPSWEEEFMVMMKSAAGRKMIRQREERKEAQMKLVEQVETGHKRKKGVILSARVHPGETNSSYMMQGAIDFLLSDCKEARLLRRHFVFKIVPMLNPDGVVYGNYRCSLVGVDLNRRWQNPNKHIHPTVYYAKRLFQMFSEVYEVVMYCDMHGHSMKKNVFMYACGQKGSDPQISKSNILTKMIPMMLAQSNKIFSIKDTKFRLEKSKQSTARIVMYKELGVLNSYTLEASFYGPSHQAALENREPREGEVSGDAHLQQKHLEGLGKDLCRLCLNFINPAIFRRKLEEISKLIRETSQMTRLGGQTSRRKEAVPPATPPSIDTIPVSPPNPTIPISDTCVQPFAVTPRMLEELQEYEDTTEEQGYFTEVFKAIEERPELNVLAQPDEESDSGGSDSLGSDNDDQKLEIVGKIAEIKMKQRSKSANRRKIKLIQRSDSVLRAKPVPIKATQGSRHVPRPLPDSLIRKNRESDLLQTIQQQLDTLYSCKAHVVKAKEDSSPRLKKGRSSQSFIDEDVVFCQVKKEGESCDPEPRVKIAKAAGGYQNFNVPPRPDIGFSPSSSFIITSMQQPNSSIITSKLNYLRKPSLNAYRRTQRPNHIPPLARNSDPRVRPLISTESTRPTELSPLSSSLCRDLEARRVG